jgi:hypothetical protein
LGASVASVSCRSSTQPDLDPRLAAGTYILQTVAGRGPVSGTFVLTAYGSAERHVSYAAPAGGTAPDYSAVGSFRLRGDSIEFALREDGGRSQYVWNPRGNWSATSFYIRYGDPADGLDIVETYRRQ